VVFFHFLNYIDQNDDVNHIDHHNWFFIILMGNIGMETITLDSLSGHQSERLTHIELVARFWGAVSRSDLVDRFDISEAAATRDFSLYRKLAPYNLAYDPSIKRYLWNEEQAKPLFVLATYKIMNTLCEGFGDSIQEKKAHSFAMSLRLKEPNLDIVSVITRAINRKLGVKVTYHSQSSPNGAHREIVPHSIVDTGLRWQIRAWDRKRNKFTDFVVNRISAASIIPSKPKDNELQGYDSAWMEEITLIMKPHPKKHNIHALLVQEYSMENNVLEVKCRKALVPYLLDSWNVDSSKNGKLDGHHIFLHLSNVDEIEVDNMFLAPGYEG